MTPDVSLVIVAYRAAAFLPSCLAALRAAAPGRTLEVVVVDNASADGTPEVVRSLEPEARIVANAENRGFAAAANQGARETRGRFLLFLNPDARVAPGALEALVVALEAQDRAGLASPRLAARDGTAQPSAWPEPRLATLAFDALLLRNLAPRSRLHRIEPASDRPVVVPCVSGACLVARRACFETLGGFDERFFLYHEDWDLCLRAGKAGFASLLVPAATAVHDLGGSAFQDRAAFWRYYHASRDAFIRKHFEGGRQRVAVTLHRMGLRLHAVASRLAGRPDEARALGAARHALETRSPRP